MDIKRLRPGNVIRISPRENEEGLLSIQEIHKESIIGEMLVPRQGYHFRIKFYEIQPIPITTDWLKKCGFNKKDEGSDIWKDSNGRVDFSFPESGPKHFIQGRTSIGKASVEYVHDFQNGYSFLTGKELTITL